MKKVKKAFLDETKLNQEEITTVEQLEEIVKEEYVKYIKGLLDKLTKEQ